MSAESVTKPIPYHTLKRMVKKKKNQKIKTYIMKSANAAEAIRTFDTTLLHMAARYENLELMMFFSNIGVNVNIQDDNQATPLMTAITHRKFEIVKLLLLGKHRINFTIADTTGKNALQLALDTKVPKFVLKYFLDGMRYSEMNSNQIADILTRNNFPLKYLLLVDDPQLTQAMLERRETIDDEESLDLLQRTMTSSEPKNVHNLSLLMNYGPGVEFRQQTFVKDLAFIIESPFSSRKYVTRVIRQLIFYNSINVYFVDYLTNLFLNTRKKRCVLLMLESRIDVHVKEEFQEDLMVYLFGNRNLDAIEILKECARTVDMHSKGRDGLSALHYAAANAMAKNVHYLLENGMDPDVQDDIGMTPLFTTSDIDCIHLLLEYGGDVQAVREDGMSVMETVECRRKMQIMVAHVAVLHAKGTFIEKKTRNAMKVDPYFKNLYTKCQNQVYWLQNSVVFQNVTLFTIISEKAEKVAPYMRNVHDPTALISLNTLETLIHWYYTLALETRLKRALKIYKLRCRARQVIAKRSRVFDADHVVVYKIVSYLNYDNLRAFK